MMPAPTPNLPLLRKAVEWAETEALKDPDESEWLQDAWRTTPEEYERDFGVPRCGTAYCVAGYVCQISGLPWVDDNVLWDGIRHTPGYPATQLLGLQTDEAACLFDGSNDIRDVRRNAEQIAARAGERL